MYFAHISLTGSVKYRDVPDSIAILDAPTSAMPIGTAVCRGWDAAGLAWWRLKVHDNLLPGFWVIIDREFYEAR